MKPEMIKAGRTYAHRRSWGVEIRIVLEIGPGFARYGSPEEPDTIVRYRMGAGAGNTKRLQGREYTCTLKTFAAWARTACVAPPVRVPSKGMANAAPRVVLDACAQRLEDARREVNAQRLELEKLRPELAFARRELEKLRPELAFARRVIRWLCDDPRRRLDVALHDGQRLRGAFLNEPEAEAAVRGMGLAAQVCVILQASQAHEGVAGKKPTRE